MEGITVIIVNYNVKYFLRQCLQSVLNSDYEGSLSVIVVDNNSTDGSDMMMQEEFPEVEYIYNQENLGFSKANNLAIAKVTDPYTLILNPDTILQEDTLKLCYQHMKTEPQVGAVGVRMVDGSGTYLPESKRGFPSPASAIYKLIGLSKLFPNSKTFNQYYLGHLAEDKVQSIDVLTGAFAFIRTDLLQEIGGFDPDYFMYGEDIELSFQIKERAKEIHYLPDTQIIHFKGESTKKFSGSYLKNFYGAMAIYAQKRNAGGSFWWSWVLNFGILISALIGSFKKLTVVFLRPILDIVILFSAAKGIRFLWATYYYNNKDYYQVAEFNPIFLSLIILAVFCYYLFGQYDLSHNKKHLLYGFFFSSLAMLSVYSLLPMDWRSSRGILLLVAVVAPILLWLSRKLYNKVLFGTGNFDTLTAKRVAIVGDQESTQNIQDIVTRFSGEESLIGTIGVTAAASLGQLTDLKSIVDSRNLNELIFCSADLPIQDIFRSMSDLGSRISYKLANNDNSSILGSDSKERVGEWYTLDVSYKITEPFHIRTKRLIDVGFAIFSVLLFPVVLIFSRQRSTIYQNLIQVLVGSKTWLGYATQDGQLNKLPQLKPYVFSIADETEKSSRVHQENLWYAKNYSTWSELVGVFGKYFS